ncbi:uncharacterized protein LOC114743465 [Neltuma alba]|uniref:uncharacterized protein LOC114743465 n=1 Tax=Neltuma alba TaxID=207710 RepID=UPI0010A596EA|nr:uncharacterized protein LOC114743465 [Prosopis alba]
MVSVSHIHSSLRKIVVFPMAASMKTSQHNRSNSVPSAPHPLISQIEEHLQRLKSSDSTSSSSSISQQLNGLQDLHGYATQMLQLPTTQRALAQGCCKILVDELLEGSLRILDICSTSKDALLQSKESLHELQSAARRKRTVGEAALTIDAGKYLSSRKNMKKAIKKAVEILKKFKKENSSDIGTESLSMISSLKEAEVVTLTLLESLLYFVSGSKIQPKQRRWPMVSMLVQPKRVACDSANSNTNEFEKVDETLQSLLSHKPQTGILVEDFLNHMENLELCIEVLEGGIEHLQRHLIRTRVSLLNIPIKY